MKFCSFLKDLTIKTRQSLRQKVNLFVGITYPMTSKRIDGSSSRAQAAWLVWKIVFVPESRQIYFGILFFAQEKNWTYCCHRLLAAISMVAEIAFDITSASKFKKTDYLNFI